MKNLINNNKGLTLVEVVISMTLMTFILSSASIFVNSTNTTKAALADVSTATQVGTDVLEGLRFEEFDSLYGGESDNEEIVQDYYKCRWAIEDSVSYKIIRLTIAWPHENPEHDIALTTIVAK